MATEHNSSSGFFTVVCCFFSLTLLSSFPQNADAGTIHHWRFENGAFLEDSAGNADLTNTTVTQIGLSDASPPSAFPVPLDSAMNDFAAEFHDTGGLSADIVPLAGSWTIEMLVRTRTLNGTFAQALFDNSSNRCNSDTNITIWFRRDGLGGALLNELSVYSGSIYGNFVALPLGFVPEIGTDYYFGFVHDDDANTLTFYVQDLAEMGPATSTSFSFQAYSFPDAAIGQIGNLTTGACGDTSFSHDGLIDEVRVSDIALSWPELYISNLLFKDGFESKP